jgi:hypothetical protein
LPAEIGKLVSQILIYQIVSVVHLLGYNKVLLKKGLQSSKALKSAQISHVQWTPLNGIPDKGINRIMGSDWSRTVHLLKMYIEKTEQVTKIENIKTDSTKILRPTHFSGPKDIKTD